MSEHKYILEPYKGMKTRYTCPTCQKRDKTFSLYIDTETGEYLHPTVGRCNRESNCGHHYTPKQYFQDNNISFDKPIKTNKPRLIAPQQKPVSIIPVDIFKASLKAHDTNNFVKYLIYLFGADITKQVVSRYFIATSKHWNGATAFWQIDTKGNIRTGKIMLYSPTTGKRVKDIEPPIYWVHKAIKQPEFELKQCLFGEHLLIDKTKPVAIVESEKTAVIASVYLPQFIWVSVGSITNLSAEKCNVLKGRTVILFPDLNGFDKWNIKAKELSHIGLFTVSDLLERKATEAEKKQGLDLADYLTKFNYIEFIKPEPEATNQHPPFQLLVDEKQFEQIKLYNWEQDIKELKNYFDKIKPPTEPIKLNSCSTIVNCSLFIKNHFATIEANNGKHIFLPYIKRLKELKAILQ